MTKPKKLLAFFFLLLPFASSVNAEEEERDFKRELCASIGAKAEKMTEKVYSNGNMASELVWADTVDAVFDVSLDLNFCGAFADLGFSAGVPLKSGTLEDSDFSGESRTHFSEHSIVIDRNFAVSARCGYEFQFWKVSLAPFIGFEYRTTKFSARDGQFEYPDESGDLCGIILDYEQEFFVPQLGVKFSLTQNDWRFLVDFAFHPFIRINTTDSHFLRSVQFYDTFKNCLGYSFDLGVRRGNFFAKSGIRMIFEKEGETSSCNIGKSDNSFIESKDISSGFKDIYYTGSIGWIF